MEGLIYTCREGAVGEDNSDEGSASQRRFGGRGGMGQGGPPGKYTAHR